MSIFKATFSESVKKQLNARQRAMIERTPQNLSYLNSRNAWIRLTSSVNIITGYTEDGDIASDDKGALARKYILQGGTLNNITDKSIVGTLKSGVGGVGGFNNAYSNTAADGLKYRLGIRPTPGITNVEIKSKTAYGSLREAVVNFQCWDIKQLEDLELLYMRPGYTLLLEWGWTPYLLTDPNDSSKILYKPTFDGYYDIINTKKAKETIWKEIFAKSNEYGNNYDAMFGYIKNYNWSARADGGYDCSTTIITMGEIIESLKVNYTPSNLDLGTKGSGGMLKQECIDPAVYDATFTGGAFNSYYQKNILAGMWAETYSLISNNAITAFANGSPLSSKNYKKTGLYLTDSTNTSNSDSITSDGVQCYITMDAFIGMINKYIIPEDSNSKGTLVELSIKDISVNGSADLLCVAHPLQVSTDLTVCAINSPLWSQGLIINAITSSAQNTDVIAIDTKAEAIATKIVKAASGARTDEAKLEEGINEITNINLLQVVNQKIIDNNKKYPGGLQDVLNKELDSTPTLGIGNITGDTNLLKKIKTKLNNFGVVIDYQTESFIINPNASSPETIERFKENTITIKYNNNPIESTTTIANLVLTTKNASQSLANIEWLKNLKPYFKDDDQYSELGVIKNIYLNVGFLYKCAIDIGLESQDKKEKSEINLYNYVKKVISSVQSALGNVSSFEIHVDPIDNKVARIIDVNYTGEKGKNIYNNLFELEVHNLKSVVRSYSMQSQIFPDQSSIIAIGSQVQGGQMGIQNNTMIDFNRQLVDRILPQKQMPESQQNLTSDRQGGNLISALTNITLYFSKINEKADPNTTKDADSTYRDIKNSLRDIIVYFQSITSSPGKNRNIIPIKFSLEMDGIGGLVIGHMFRLSKDILPKGYKGEGAGVELGQAITSIAHTLSGTDWTTKVDALNIVLTDDSTLIPFKDIDLSQIVSEAVGNAQASGTTSETSTTQTAINGAGSGPYDTSAVATYYKNKGYTNGNIPNTELVYLNTDDTTSNGLHRLHPKAAAQWQALVIAARAAGFTKDKFNISYIVTSAYRSRANQKSGPGRATPGSSPHGWGGALDIQQLINAQRTAAGVPQSATAGQSAGKVPATKVRNSDALYKWLAANGPIYGWYNPARLLNGPFAESWHFEYWGPI
jgi:hypothetical protein